MAVKQETIDKYLGKVFKTNKCGDVEVIDMLDRGKLKVKFLNTGNIRVYDKASVTRQEMRDVEAFPVYTTGVQDIKGYLVKGQPAPKDYSVWSAIRQRCYNKNCKDSFLAYEGCTMSEDFLVFSKFKEWYNSQIGCDQDGWHIDKDLLVKGNKVYSAETCVLLPNEINSAIVVHNRGNNNFPMGVIYNCTKTRYRARIQRKDGWESLGTYDTPEEAFYAYKPVKEAYVKSIADKWREQIDPRAYQALMNWTIEIDD